MARNGIHDVLLLDFGGVCLLNPVELHHQTESVLDMAEGTLDWFGPIDPASDELWRLMTAGDTLTERDYWALRAIDVGEAAGRDLSVRDYMTLLYDPPTAEIIRPEAIATVEWALSSGYGVSILTNDMRAFHGPQWEAGVDLLRIVDHIIDCSDTDILKPDPRAYDRAVGIVGVPPARILFVDDQHRNVDGGTAAGLDSVWFDIANASESWDEIAAQLAGNYE